MWSGVRRWLEEGQEAGQKKPQLEEQFEQVRDHEVTAATMMTLVRGTKEAASISDGMREIGRCT